MGDDGESVFASGSSVILTRGNSSDVSILDPRTPNNRSYTFFSSRFSYTLSPSFNIYSLTLKNGTERSIIAIEYTLNGPQDCCVY